MGRTVLSFNQKILSIESEWNKFRRALRKEDQELLDDLFGFAKYHSAPSSYFSTPNPMEPVLMAMLIEILKEVRRLKFELRAKEEDLDVREKSD
ncbi:MAG: hypothetical protein O6918_02885 [Deltaproteobacteria bacterium]|nr:hypothetical protein [Deltaproteobacteria bacterium]